MPVTGGIATTIQSTLSLNNRASARLPPRSLKPLRLSTSPGRYALAAIYSALSWVISYNQKSLLRSFCQDAAQQKTARLLSDSGWFSLAFSTILRLLVICLDLRSLWSLIQMDRGPSKACMGSAAGDSTASTQSARQPSASAQGFSLQRELSFFLAKTL